MTTRRWAATTGALTLLCGASPSYAFLAGHVVCVPQSGRSSGGGSRGSCTRPRVDSCLSALSPSVAAEVEAACASGGVSSSPSTDAAEETGADADTGRRWIKDMKAGQKVIGYVSDTTKFAAFVDVGVVRHGTKGKIMPVIGFLHQSDIRSPYALEGTTRARSCEVEVKKGIHLTAYVKDVFPNAGRLTLSLDPSINKDKVLKLRDSKRQRTRSQRRERVAEKGSLPKVGDVVQGYVRKVRDSLLLVDVMFEKLSVLHGHKIREAVGGGSFVNLTEKAKAGDVVTVRIEGIAQNKRRGSDDEQAIISFVGWGGLDAQEKGEEAVAIETPLQAEAEGEGALESNVDDTQNSPSALADGDTEETEPVDEERQ